MSSLVVIGPQMKDKHRCTIKIFMCGGRGGGWGGGNREICLK